MFRFLSDASYKTVLILLAAVLLATTSAYLPSLSIPFYLDDRGSVVNHASVYSQGFGSLWNDAMKSRVVSYMSFWLNYQYGELDPHGYHVFNIALHLVNVVLVFLLSRQILNFFATKGVDGELEHQCKRNRLWALAIAALWALHPLNSQAVIYVVQRMASIVAIFYLLTIIFYIKARTAKELNPAVLYGTLTIVCFIGGFLSKQNYVAVWIFLYFWELLTAGPAFRRFLIKSTLGGIVALMLIGPFISDFWTALDKFTRDFNAGTRSEYFYTQMVVLWDYIARFFVPLPLQLDIGVTVRKSLEPVVALAMLGHMTLIVVAYRARKIMPLFCVGILFFYASHMVESFIIPIKDLAFEHRTYIGNIGLLLALVAVLKFSLESSAFRRYQPALVGGFCVLLLLGAVGIYQRALLWQDPLAFYANEVKHSPEHSRANASYGNELLKQQRYAESETYLRKSVEMDIANGRVTASGLTAFMTALYQQKKYQQAAKIVMMGLKYIHSPNERSMLLSNLAVGYIYMGYCDFAMGLLNTAIQLNPNNKDARTNMAYCQQMRARGR